MKKYLMIAAAALAAAALVSCNPDNEAGGGGGTVNVPSWPEADATTVCLNEVNGSLKGIELYNPTDAPVNLEGWTIVKNNEVPPTEGAPYWTGVATDVIPAKGYMVIKASKASATLAAMEILFSTNAGTGGLSGKKAVKLELKNAAGVVVDFFDRGFTKAGNTEPALEDWGDNSAARNQDGKAPWKVKAPSYGASNNAAEVIVTEANPDGKIVVDPE